MSQFEVTLHDNFARIAFSAMASPCEVLVRNMDIDFCQSIGQMIYTETTRIEKKYSRYIKGNLVDRMNKSHGKQVKIDSETFNLLEYARNLYEMSDGLFDITSGVLRNIWNFTPNSKPPNKSQIQKEIKKIGFDRLLYDRKTFQMASGMEIDFGGIGKEYAVDQVVKRLEKQCSGSKSSFLVNFGGDLSACKLDENAPPWTVGLESPKNDCSSESYEWPESFISISHGSVATSGNTKRFLEYKGKRYGHLLNPKTGYPIEHAPQSITTFSDNCVMAGSLSSLAMLQGKEAETFLTDQSVKHLCVW